MFNPAPKPWMARPSTNGHMLVATPASTRPTPKVTTATTNGRSGPLRSETSPATTMPTRLVVRKAEKASA
jgi:hypothetical protein